MTFADANGDIFAHEGFYLALLLGLCLGSLATALAYRLPRGISMIAQERSQCPSCGRQLSILDLVPVFSWLALRGRCRGCKKSYGLRYLGIECATLALCMGFYFLAPMGAPVLALYFAAPALVAMVAIDFEWQILPDKLNLWLAGTAVLAVVLQCGLLPLAAAPADWTAAGRLALLALGGALLYAGLALALRAGVQWWLKKDPLGLGDVKFFAAAGLWLGPDPLLLAFYMMAVGLSGLFLGLVWRYACGSDEFPFGPCLIVVFGGFLLAGWGLLPASGQEYVNMF